MTPAPAASSTQFSPALSSPAQSSSAPASASRPSWLVPLGLSALLAPLGLFSGCASMSDSSTAVSVSVRQFGIAQNGTPTRLWTVRGDGVAFDVTDLGATLASASYLGSGLGASGSTGSGGAVGPFIPHHFDVNTLTACGSFSYAGQPFPATVTARNASGTTTLNFWIWFHTFFAITTIFIWAGLIVASLRRFPAPPQPGPFSATHRRWGRIGMIWMLVTGVTAIPVYVYGFAL